jgi:hypothetical protein
MTTPKQDRNQSGPVPEMDDWERFSDDAQASLTAVGGLQQAARQRINAGRRPNEIGSAP